MRSPACLAACPQPPDVGQRAPVAPVEEGQVGQRGDQRRHVAGAELLPRQLVDTRGPRGWVAKYAASAACAPAFASSPGRYRSSTALRCDSVAKPSSPERSQRARPRRRGTAATTRHAPLRERRAASSSSASVRPRRRRRQASNASPTSPAGRARSRARSGPARARAGRRRRAALSSRSISSPRVKWSPCWRSSSSTVRRYRALPVRSAATRRRTCTSSSAFANRARTVATSAARSSPSSGGISTTGQPSPEGRRRRARPAPSWRSRRTAGGDDVGQPRQVGRAVDVVERSSAVEHDDAARPARRGRAQWRPGAARRLAGVAPATSTMRRRGRTPAAPSATASRRASSSAPT